MLTDECRSDVGVDVIPIENLRQALAPDSVRVGRVVLASPKWLLQIPKPLPPRDIQHWVRLRSRVVQRRISATTSGMRSTPARRNAPVAYTWTDALNRPPRSVEIG